MRGVDGRVQRTPDAQKQSLNGSVSFPIWKALSSDIFSTIGVMTDSDQLPKWQHTPDIKIPHKLVNDLVNVVVDYYREHIRRDVQDGRLKPARGWLFLQGLLVAAMQTYASICALLAEKRPKPLMLQANVLGRSLFEIFTTVMALTDDIDTGTNILLREYIKMLAVDYRRQVARFGDDPSCKEYLSVFRTRLDDLVNSSDVPADVVENPDVIANEWPTPGRMLRKKKPYVSGTRHTALKAIYDAHSSNLSAQAHARMAAISMAMLVDTPEMRWNPGQDESNIVTTALLHVACLLTELEFAGGYPHHPRLAELWTYLRTGDGEAQEIWALRYEQIVAMLPPAA